MQPTSITPEAIAAAEEQAAKDGALLAQLNEARQKAREARAEEPEQEPFTITTDRVPLNRAQRRAQVRQYASLLAATERQTPIVHPTIIPRSKRRRRPGQHGRLQHA